MSKVILGVDKSDIPSVSLKIDGNHLGTIFGTLEFPETEFGRKYDIFTILKDKSILAIIWNASLAEEKAGYGSYRIRMGE